MIAIFPKFAKGADLLIFDAMYSEEEYSGVAGPPKIGWGHSTWEQAIKTANGAGVGTLCLFHHDPTRNDDALDKLLAKVKKHRKEAIAAAEGLVIQL